jgi:hypothetical protein
MTSAIASTIAVALRRGCQRNMRQRAITSATARLSSLGRPRQMVPVARVKMRLDVEISLPAMLGQDGMILEAEMCADLSPPRLGAVDREEKDFTLIH